MADDILKAHEEKLTAIIEECRAATMSPLPGQMIYYRFLGPLSELQGETAKKLGKAVDDASLLPKFDAEKQLLKGTCGL